MGRGALLVVVLGASACPQRDAGVGVEKSQSAGTGTGTGTNTRATTTTTTTTKTLGVGITGVVVAEGIGVSIQAREGVELAAEVQVIQGDAGAAASGLVLRRDCKATGCVQLAAGSELFAPPWLGQPEGERCGALFRPARAGDYTLRVRSCDGSAEAEAHVRWSGP
jgi:hypothetical protein